MSATRTMLLKRGLPAREVDRRLRAAVAELRRAERSAVLWFGEVLHRKLYRDLGFGSIQQYAEVALGFGPGKTAQFIRLACALRELPQLAESLARGDVTWTQARTVAAVAAPETEAAWLAVAKGMSSRGLEHQVRVARHQAAKARRVKGQLGLDEAESGDMRPLEPGAPGHEDADRGEAGRRGTKPGEEGAERKVEDHPPARPVGSLPLPRNVHLRLSPEQGARYEALLEAARKQGALGDKADLLLAGLEALVTAKARTRAPSAGAMPEGRDGDSEAGGGRNGGPRNNRIFASPYQVLVQLCPSCAGGSVVTGRGSEPLHPDELKAILCDARVRRTGERNKAVIPAKVRREVLQRDSYRCRSSGCGSARFLAVHHKTPREAGGTNDPENLVTLCAACHRAIHVYGGDGPLSRPAAGGPKRRRRSRRRSSGDVVTQVRAGPPG